MRISGRHRRLMHAPTPRLVERTALALFDAFDGRQLGDLRLHALQAFARSALVRLALPPRERLVGASTACASR
jgi:hypothetical protein